MRFISFTHLNWFWQYCLTSSNRLRIKVSLNPPSWLFIHLLVIHKGTKVYPLFFGCKSRLVPLFSWILNSRTGWERRAECKMWLFKLLDCSWQTDQNDAFCLKWVFYPLLSLPGSSFFPTSWLMQLAHPAAPQSAHLWALLMLRQFPWQLLAAASPSLSLSLSLLPPACSRQLSRFLSDGPGWLSSLGLYGNVTQQQ